MLATKNVNALNISYYCISLFMHCSGFRIAADSLTRTNLLLTETA